jgi:hypothetical protein
MEDADPIPMDGYWNLNNGDQVFYPTQSHPNCRCTTGLVFPDLLNKVDPLGYERWVSKGGPGSGENPGHAFRGNQYTGGIPASRASGRSGGKKTPEPLVRNVVGPEGVEMQLSTPVAKFAKLHGVEKDWSAVRAVSPSKREKTADAYEKMQSIDRSKEVLEAWDLVASVVDEQFEMLTKGLGVKVQFVDEDPYSTYENMLSEFQRTNTLKVLRTSATGGHPYWENATNDKFRAVHDAFGHLGTGRGFDRHGEEAAFQAHRSMFPKEAWPALATELRGQNQYLLHTGDFGEQKIAFLPVELQKRLSRLLKRSARVTADDDNAYDKGGSHHVSCGRHFANIKKHAEHDQKDHGKWATGLKADTESLLEQARKITAGKKGGALVEAITGVKPVETTIAAVGDPSGEVMGSGVSFVEKKDYRTVKSGLVVVESLMYELYDAQRTLDETDPELGFEMASEISAATTELFNAQRTLNDYLEGSRLLAANVDLDLLTTAPPAGKMSSWADSVADNRDGGVGFINAIKQLAAYPVVYGGSPPRFYAGGFNVDGANVVKIATGELVSAHIGKATSGISDTRLNSRIIARDKPAADQQEQPLSDVDFNNDLYDMLPRGTFTKISNIMDSAKLGPGKQWQDPDDRGKWVNEAWNPIVAGAMKHSVNGRIAERIYEQAEGNFLPNPFVVPDRRSLDPMSLSNIYIYAAEQTRQWSRSSASRDSALLQREVAGRIGNKEPYTKFAERNGLDKLRPDEYERPFIVAYARAVYAETQALLDLDPAELGLKVARGIQLKLSPELDLPVKVVQQAITVGSGVQSERLRDSSWQVSSDVIGRQPLSSWSTKTVVANQFAGLNDRKDAHVPKTQKFSVVQRSVIPDSQIFSTALTGPGCLNEAEIIAIEGTTGTTSVSVVYGGDNPEYALALSQARDADGDGWIGEGTDQEQFVGKADKKFKYDRKVPEQKREGVASLLTWIPDNWDAAYLDDEPVEKHAEHDQKDHGKWAKRGPYADQLALVDESSLHPDNLRSDASDYLRMHWVYYPQQALGRTMGAAMMGLPNFASQGDQSNEDTYGEGAMDALHQGEPPQQMLEDMERGLITGPRQVALMMKDAAESDPTTRMSYRGMVVTDRSPILNLIEGDTFKLPPSSFSPSLSVANEFRLGGRMEPVERMMAIDDAAVFGFTWVNVRFDLVPGAKVSVSEAIIPVEKIPFEYVANGEFEVIRKSVGEQYETELRGPVRDVTITIRQTSTFDPFENEYISVEPVLADWEQEN